MRSEMKIVYIFCLLIIGSFNTVAQELNFNDLIYLYTNRLDLDKCDTYLARKNFVYFEYRDETYLFSYNKTSPKLAQAFIFLGTRFVILQSVKRQTFDYYKNVASSYNIPLIDSGTDKLGSLFFTYMNDKYYFSLSQGMDEAGTGNTSYMIYFRIRQE